MNASKKLQGSLGWKKRGVPSRVSSDYAFGSSGTGAG